MFKSESILGYVILFLVIVIIIKNYYDNDFFQLKCIVSDVNGKKYCVRERENMKPASDLLANTTEKLITIVEHLADKYPEQDNVKRLVKNFNPKKIKEILPTSEYTAYSENKGEKIAFCLNKQKHDNENLIDESTLTFVAIHELSHVMTVSIGHKSEFWENFKFLLENAKEAGIHQPVDYKQQPKEYCGMKIHDNPYYDA